MSDPKEKAAGVREQGLVRFGLGLANWSERWFPDPLIFALIGIVVVFGAVIGGFIFGLLTVRLLATRRKRLPAPDPVY